MLSISSEKQRNRRPFFKFCLAYGWAGGWRAEGPRLATRKYIIELFIFNVSNARNILQDCVFLLCEMLAISIEKQRKRPPVLKLSLAVGWAGGGRPGPH